MKISELKKDFKNYLIEQNPAWSLQTVCTYAADAFWAYNNHLVEDFFVAIWDEFGLDNTYLIIYDFLFDNNELRALQKAKAYRNAMSFLSKYLHLKFDTLENVIISIEIDDADIIDNNKIIIADYCRETSISYSYKLVLIKAIANLVKNNDELTIANIVNFFDLFYTKKYLENSLMEKNDSLFSKLNFDIDKAKLLLVKQPLYILENDGVLRYLENRVVLSPDIYEQFLYFYDDILKMCDARLNKYYSRLNKEQGHLYSIYEYIDSEGSRFGITRIELCERDSNEGSCIKRYSKLSFDEAYIILDKLSNNNKTINYFGNPLHILQYDTNGRLINSFDSLLEAECIVGRNSADIDAFCKGEKRDPFFIWKYNEDCIVKDKNKTTTQNMRNSFILWMSKSKSLSDSSIKKYSSAIDTISKDMQILHIISRNLYFELDLKEYKLIRQRIISNAFFIMKNNRGNNMYSVALQHYEDFLANLMKLH